MHARSRGLAVLTVAAMGILLACGAAAAQDDDDDMSTMAPQASIAPMASMAPGLVVEGAWTRESPMMELAGAAFMVIRNGTTEDDALVSASSAAAETVEIHQTTQAADGTMAMAPVEEIPIPAGGSALLEPGGYHVMLIGLVEPLVEGTSIDLTLDFAQAGDQTVSVPVMAIGPMGVTDDDSSGMDDQDDDSADADDMSDDDSDESDD
jgi:copper(I)-binding protein